MKRRKRKWPLFVGVFALLAISLSIGPYRLKKKTKPQRVEYSPVTWSDFTEHKRLQMLLKGFAIESVVDVPCADLQNFPKEDFEGIRYIGITPSKDRARALQSQFGSKLRTFLDMEVTVDVLPKADLILCWDMLCSLSPSKTKAAIEQFKRSGAHFILMRHFPEVKKNPKNRTGDMQPVNWTLPPYNFPEPIIHIMEKGEYGMESLALWNMENL
jgi:hypothetical protein